MDISGSFAVFIASRVLISAAPERPLMSESDQRLAAVSALCAARWQACIDSRTQADVAARTVIFQLAMQLRPRRTLRAAMRFLAGNWTNDPKGPIVPQTAFLTALKLVELAQARAAAAAPAAGAGSCAALLPSPVLGGAQPCDGDFDDADSNCDDDDIDVDEDGEGQGEAAEALDTDTDADDDNDQAPVAPLHSPPAALPFLLAVHPPRRVVVTRKVSPVRAAADAIWLSFCVPSAGFKRSTSSNEPIVYLVSNAAHTGGV